MKTKMPAILAAILTASIFSQVAFTIYFAMHHPDLLQSIGLGAAFILCTIVVYSWIKGGLTSMQSRVEDNQEQEESVP